MTDGYTGADIASVSNTAVMLALKEHIMKSKNPEEAKKTAKTVKVSRRHFQEALEKIKPISSQELQAYQRFAQQFSDTGRSKVAVTATSYVEPFRQTENEATVPSCLSFLFGRQKFL